MECAFFRAGEFGACINAATMALVDAGIPVKDMVCACSVAFIEETTMLGKIVMDCAVIFPHCWGTTMQVVPVSGDLLTDCYLSWKLSLFPRTALQG